MQTTNRTTSARLALGLAALIAAAVLAAIALEPSSSAPRRAVVATPPATFYDLPTRPPSAPPGTVVRSLRLSSPPRYRLWAVLYHSRDSSGADTIESGLVAVPSGRPRAGRFPVVSWGHPTTGFTPAAAPSRFGAPGSAAVLQALTGRGYAVATTEYEGLGVGGPPAYEVGASAGHAMLDAVRAAHAIAGDRLAATTALVGHSDGGQAALWAGQLQPAYALELRVRGVVASAPGANLSGALSHAEETPELEANVLRLLGAWNRTYGLPINGLLTAAGIRDVSLLMSDQPIPNAAAPFRARPSSSPRLMRLARLNTPGATRTPAPILMLVGTGDREVAAASNVALAHALQRRGDSVRLLVVPGAGHNDTPTTGASAIFGFLATALS